MNFEEIRIKSYKTWTLYLNQFQCYLGRVCLVANRKDARDFIETTPEERSEFYQICEQVNAALKALFAPDLMNYASLGNNFNHLHVHVIPRYEKERTFSGIKFVDKRWGKNYAPYDRDFKLGDKDLMLIRDAIAAQLTAIERQNKPDVLIREAQESDSDLIKDLMAHNWGGEPLLVRGQNFFPSELPGFLAFDGDKVAGFIFYTVEGTESEVIVFEAFKKHQGLGTRLLGRYKAKAKSIGIKRLHLTTHNDNLDALRFYQRRGFRIFNVHFNSMEQARKQKPVIQETGDYGIPIRDEIDLEMNL